MGFTDSFIEFIQNIQESESFAMSLFWRAMASHLLSKENSIKSAIFLAPAIIKPELTILQKLSKKVGPKIQFLHKISFLVDDQAVQAPNWSL